MLCVVAISSQCLHECFVKPTKLCLLQIDQVKEFVNSEFEQMATMEFLQKNSNITVKPIS